MLKWAHDWGSNIITIQGNGIVRTITITKHLVGKIRRLEVLLCYDYHNAITNEEEYVIFAIELELSSIGIINSPKTIQFVKTIDMEIMDIDVKASILEHEFGV
jgi:hypothetical protein